MYIAYWFIPADDSGEAFCTTLEAAEKLFENYCRQNEESFVYLCPCSVVDGIVIPDWDAPIRERKGAY